MQNKNVLLLKCPNYRESYTRQGDRTEAMRVQPKMGLVSLVFWFSFRLSFMVLLLAKVMCIWARAQACNIFLYKISLSLDPHGSFTHMYNTFRSHM